MPEPKKLDTATIDLIFALRDSLTDSGPSRLDFWSGGRGISALQTAAAGADCAAQAVTIAARKLQIPQLSAKASVAVKKAAEVIDLNYAAWAAHVDRSIVYIFALADVERQTRRATKQKNSTEEPTF